MRPQTRGDGHVQVSKSLGGVLVAGALAFTILSPATASASTIAGTQASWDCYDGPTEDGGVWATCGYNDYEYVNALFWADDERLELRDELDNDRPAVAYLTVEGSGTARFVGHDVYDLSFSEGKDIELTVCTSLSDNAVCRTKSGGHT